MLRIGFFEREQLMESAPDVFFFGDSQSRSVAWTDWSKKPLGRMVAERLRPVPMHEVGHIAWHTEVFRALAHALAAMPKHPRCMVFAIHLREFSAQWVESNTARFAGG